MDAKIDKLGDEIKYTAERNDAKIDKLDAKIDKLSEQMTQLIINQQRAN